MIKKRVPMIYHTNRHPLDWEKGNVLYGEARGLGKRYFLPKDPSLNDRHSLKEILSEIFALRTSMNSGEKDVPEAHIDFHSNLRKTVQFMMCKK